MPGVAEVTDQLIAAALPVIFLDTCILLDVIRAVKRRSPNHVDHAIKLLNAATTVPTSCVVVVSHLVHLEWVKNQQSVLDEAKKHLSEIQEQSDHFHDACDNFGIARSFARASYTGSGLADRLHDLSKRILDSTTIIDSDKECNQLALERVYHYRPPSKQGREIKDCVIIEECLAVCRGLQADGFSRNLVFCTSNTTDYCERPHQPHPDLAADFLAVGLRFTASLPHGFHDLMR